MDNVSIDTVRLDPKNARLHPTRNIEQIKNSLRRFGQQKPIVCTRDNIIRAGNGTWEAAKQLGWETINVLFTDLSDIEAVAYSVADNRTSDTSEFDPENLTAILDELVMMNAQLDDSFFSTTEIDKLLASISKEDPKVKDADIVPAVETKVVTELGDIWRLGDHFIMCGDASKIDDLRKLVNERTVNGVVTSPPYAEQRKAKYGGIRADNYSKWFDPIQKNLRAVMVDNASFFLNIKPHVDDGARSLYVMRLIMHMVEVWQWRFVDEFAWIHAGMPGKYGERLKNRFEPVYQFTKNEYPIKTRFENVAYDSDDVPSWSVGSNAEMQGSGDPLRGRGKGRALPGNVLEIKVNGETVEHPAVYPVKLPEFFMLAYSDRADNWLDPFGGSGTTLMAAERTGRRAMLMELKPEYVDVALKRWADYTGKDPLRMDGKTWSALRAVK